MKGLLALLILLMLAAGGGGYWNYQRNAHMDEEAAKANPFFEGRVAHGYFLVSAAAGLFVDPDPGPVLANYGLDNLRGFEVELEQKKLIDSNRELCRLRQHDPVRLEALKRLFSAHGSRELTAVLRRSKLA